MDSQKNAAANIVAAPEAKLHFLDYWRIIRIRKAIILTVFVLVVLTTVTVTVLMRPTYCGITAIKVEKDTQGSPIGLETQVVQPYDPYFIETEFRTIKSQLILDQVISNLDLNVKWGAKFANETLRTPETRELLLKYLTLSPARNTKYIEIRFYSDDKNEAAQIANEIATAYQNFRITTRDEAAFAGINAYKKQYEEQMDKVHKAQEEVDRLRTELKINDADAEGDSPSPTLEADTLRRLEAQRIDSQAEYATALAGLTALKSKTHEELKNILPEFTHDNLLQEYLSGLANAENTLVKLQADFGPEHPEVQRQASQVADLRQKVDHYVDGLLDALQAKVDASKAHLDTITSEVEKARQTDLEKSANGRPYYEARRKLQELQNFARALNLKIDAESVGVKVPGSTTIIADRADPTTMKPVSPKKGLNISLGVIFGLIVGIGLAFFIEYLDTSVKTIDDVERALQSPVLGVIPQNVGRVIDEGAESPHAEAYRVLRTNLLFSRKDEKLTTIAVVSAGAGEGKSTTLFNLATVFAQNGQRVLIVDSDLRRPSLHKLFRVTNNLGLTNYLLKQNTLEEVIQTTGVPTLHFLASGKLPSSSLGILSSSAMKDLINELKQRYDFVFFDSPPIMGVSDASVLASEVDMTLQVIQYRRYPQPMNIRAKQMIEKVGGNLMGIVLNNINMAQDESYYYYSGYYHEYYYAQNQNADEAEARANEKTRLDIKQKT